MKIDRDQIVAAALELLDERGLDGLTTRALADRLGVRQPALYWHFKDRQALLEAMNQAILAGVRDAPPPAPGEDWREALVRLGLRFRAALMSHRDGARLHAGSPPDSAQLAQYLVLMMNDHNVPLRIAIPLMSSIGCFTVGWVLEEQAERAAGDEPDPQTWPEGPIRTAVEQHMAQDDAASYETGLRFLIRGAEAAMRESGAS